MWWSRPARAVAAAVLVLAAGPAGCGFRPLYGAADSAPGLQSEAAAELAGIHIAAIPDRLGQQLRNSLLQRLTPAGEPADPRYILTVKLDQTLESLGHRKDAKATLGRMTLRATFSLHAGENRPVVAGTARSLVSFNYLGPRYASIAAEKDAEERAMTEVAEDIRRQLAVYFETRGAAAR